MTTRCYAASATTTVAQRGTQADFGSWFRARDAQAIVTEPVYRYQATTWTLEDEEPSLQTRLDPLDREFRAGGTQAASWD